MIKVSFIIPVYKVEKYLNDCVKSILSQTYKDYEILLIDDGSPDNCPAMCDYWASIDPRIKSYHKPNGGLSDARNYGLQYSTGDYIVFVDSDDFWRYDDSLGKLVKLAANYPYVDFVGFNCQYYYHESRRYSLWIQYAKELSTPVTGEKAIKMLVKSGTFPMSACMKLMKRSTLVNNQILFKKEQLGEDIPWFLNLLDKSNSCLFVNEYIYAYRQNVEGSITASGGERSFNSLLDIVKTEVEKMKFRTFSSETIEALYSFLAYELCILMAFIRGLPSDKQKDARKELKSLTWLFVYVANPKVKKVSIVYKIFGFYLTELLLRLYVKYRG